ncbi:hypothetical protein F5B22DRAFT_473345 [Xylaria bambusicola]|uniref:uncharacterized protein n=1 Tax=Xylaria bambusicola TaxID=326684 RepID=UPI002007AD63|nr:uncharacterized protein F5B22DRAFT_473345 [Xylaria bambusicola]KAI0506242.1 hypothetical protein F5B22DRAFT_473345 [Xylaria bambusicola]
MEPIRIRRVRTPAPRVNTRDLAARDLGPRVLDGCCVEAERADRVGYCLQGLRNALPEHLQPHLTAVIDHLQITSHLLRDLADKSQVHLSQVPVMIDYLNVILPCLCRTLRDIMGYYEDKYRSKEHRWRTMYHEMSNELPGTTLPARFVMYNQYLASLNYMLTRDPNFDVNAMEALRIRILQLRDARKIDPPSPIRTDLIRRDTALDFWKQETDSHWAEAIFTHPLPSRREFRKRGNYRSDAFGPLDRMGHLDPFPDDVTILVKRTFENDRVSIIIFLRHYDQLPFMLVRTRTPSGEPWVSIRSIDALTIERESTSVLYLTYWNPVEKRRKAWASLAFLTWEELVLFYCTFVGLRNEWVRTLDPREFIIRKEKRLFQAQIVEDEVEHYLAVVEDFHTKGRRLHVMTRDGQLRNCPVWTAFIPPDPPEDWLIHKAPHRVWLRNLQVYSFCDEYRPHRQRRGKFGHFQIRFAHATATTRFKQLFNPISDPSVEDASEERDDGEDDYTPSEE